jgi:regulatory protein
MPAECTARALKLLAGRSHFRRQLEAKLRSKGFESDDIEITLERLTELGYLDDTRTAIELVESRLRRGPMGRRRLRAELERRGADESALEAALDEALSGRDDRSEARRAAEMWWARRRSSKGAMAVEPLARHLERLGFETASILDVVGEVRSGAFDPES